MEIVFKDISMYTDADPHLYINNFILGIYCFIVILIYINFILFSDISGFKWDNFFLRKPQ